MSTTDRKLAARVSLRASTEADEPFLVRVFASTREQELALLAPEHRAAFVQAQSSLQRRAYAELYPGAAFDIVLVDGVPAGRFYVHRGREEIRIVDIALLPPFRGTGIGTHLLKELLGEAAARRVPVALHVFASSGAQALYLRLGFVVVELTPPHVMMRWSPPSLAPSRPAS